jgi:hypothetical protein
MGRTFAACYKKASADDRHNYQIYFSQLCNTNKWNLNLGACVFEVTSGMNMIGRHFHNRSITVVVDSIGGRGTNEVDEFSSLGNTAVNQEAEAE